jgi:hypothetical protein
MGGAVAELPPGPVKRSLGEVRAAAREAGIARELIDPPLEQATRAMERAGNARSAGDVTHGAMLERLAAQWSQLAMLVLRAASAEQAAQKAAVAARDQAEKLERARTLLAEQQARRGRLQARLAEERARIERETRASADREKSRIGQGRAAVTKPNAPKNPGGAR